LGFKIGGGNTLFELLIEYANGYIDESTTVKEGYCKRCLNEKWRDSANKKTLYEYNISNETMYICEHHVGCMEIGKELSGTTKYMNDIEKRNWVKGLDEIIKEGENLLN
jgi:hypothetical protein